MTQLPHYVCIYPSSNLTNISTYIHNQIKLKIRVTEVIQKNTNETFNRQCVIKFLKKEMNKMSSFNK